MPNKRFIDPKTYLEQEKRRKKKPAHRRAALYTRVSDDLQEKQCSIETQIACLREYCEREGIEVHDVYRDEDVRSEVPHHLRPDGHRLIEDAKAAKFDLVLVYLSCRWSRYPEVYHAGRKTLEKLGIDLDSPGERLSWETPTEAFASDVRLRTNQFYRDLLLKYTLDGRYQWAAKGVYTGGPPHYGYQVVPAPEFGEGRKKYIVDPYEYPVIVRIFRLCVEGWSCPQIAKLFNKEKIPVPAKSEKYAKSRHPRVINCKGVWSPQRIALIIRDRLFTGACVYGGSDHHTATIRVAPPIIDLDTYEKAQLCLAENKRGSSRNAKRYYLFRRKLFCEHCGVGYSGSTSERSGNRAVQIFYRCGGYTKHLRGLQDEPCPVPKLPAEEWEADLWEATVHELEQYEETLTRLREEWKGEQDDSERLRKERDRLKKQEADLENEETMALRGKSKIGTDLDSEQAKRVIKSVGEELERVTIKLTSIEQALAESTRRQGRLENAEQYLEEYRQMLKPGMSPEEKKRIIDGMLDRAVVRQMADGTGYEIVYYFWAEKPKDARIVAITSTDDCNNPWLLAAIHRPLLRR